jgi:hypothetical protein
MAHHATMISAFDRRQPNTTVFQKTVAINDFYLEGPQGYPLGQIQSQGRTEAVTLKSETPWYGRPIPMWAWERWADRAVDWLAMSEDLPSDDNRVTIDGDGCIRLTYRQNNLRPHDAGRFRSNRETLARDQKHDASVRHALFRQRSETVGAGSVLSNTRRAKLVRRRCVVLPFVSGGESWFDDHRAGAQGCGSHQGDRLTVVVSGFSRTSKRT